MYPEAGGSSSFARHAFNEFWSFFAAWAQMLNYTITIAISAFFVPHYLGGLFFPFLKTRRGTSSSASAWSWLLCAINVVGVTEAAALNIVLAITDFATQVLLVVIGAFLVLSPHTLIHNVQLGVAPQWKNFLIAIPVGMIAYTGIETISNMAEEAKDESRTIPARHQPGGDRGVRDLCGAARGGPVGAAGAQDPRPLPDAAGPEREQGRVRRRPGAGDRQAPEPRPAPARRRDLRRPAGGDDPVHRHQRRHHRRLAPGLLDGTSPPGPRWAAAPASALPHAVDRDPPVRGHRLPDDDPRPGRLPGQHVRVRGDALVHDRPPVGDPPAAEGARPQAPLPGPGTLRVPAASFPCSRCSAAWVRSWRS